MKNRLVMAMTGVACVVGMSAAPITPDQALQRLQENGGQKAPAATRQGMQLSYTAKADDGRAAAYVFTTPGQKGFTILSADDVAVPVLGYSDTGEFNENDVPAPVKWWLSEYGRRIDFLESKGVKGGAAATYAPADWEAIAPLCKTTWNQMAPYNDQAPEVNGKKTPTGCVATSFAQALKYFNYPERGTGIVEYKWGSRNMKMNLNTTVFKWDQMLDSYSSGGYTEEQANAVAVLMKACGYSVEMNYGEQASGAVSYKLVNALVNNFGYDAGISYEDRNYYSPTQWAEMIYDNIKNCGPVIYDGTSIEGGHSFICDGYDGNGYFHFNWGWGGLSDGYYVLDVLNPEAQGTGGSVGGFNYSQNAVIGMKKPTGEPAKVHYGNLTILGSTIGEVDGDNIVFGFEKSSMLGLMNTMWKDVNVGVYVALEPFDNGETTYAVPEFFNPETGNTFDAVISLRPNYYISYPNSMLRMQIPSNLADGQYRLVLMTKDLNVNDAPLQPMTVTYGFANYCVLDVKDGAYEVTNITPAQLKFESVEFNENLYLDRNTMMRANLVNDSDLELSTCIQPFLVRNGKRQYMGDNMIVQGAPNSTTMSEWIVKFYQTAAADDYGYDKTYTVELLDRTTGMSLGMFGEVTMGYVSGALKVKVDRFEVEDATKQDVVAGDRTFRNTYVIADKDVVDIDFDYTITQGYFDSSLSMGVQWYNPETKRQETYIDQFYHGYPFLAQGESQNLDFHLDFSDAPKTSVYTVRVTYVNKGAQQMLASMTFAFDETGAVEIVAADDSEAEYYNLQGVKISNPKQGEIVIRRKGGKTEKMIFNNCLEQN